MRKLGHLGAARVNIAHRRVHAGIPYTFDIYSHAGWSYACARDHSSMVNEYYFRPSYTDFTSQ